MSGLASIAEYQRFLSLVDSAARALVDVTQDRTRHREDARFILRMRERGELTEDEALDRLGFGWLPSWQKRG
jgi:hypothetical protein